MDKLRSRSLDDFLNITELTNYNFRVQTQISSILSTVLHNLWSQDIILTNSVAMALV